LAATAKPTGPPQADAAVIEQSWAKGYDGPTGLGTPDGTSAF
jgi:hypothetical protein